jgi:hypothetical protein
MRGLWVKTLFTCGRASAAPLASHPPWKKFNGTFYHIIVLICYPRITASRNRVIKFA